jgi:Ca2+-binding EF-hand superfamily protein
MDKEKLDKLKELANDPAALEAKIKEYWGKIDDKGAGSLTLEDFKTRTAEIAKSINFPLLPTEEQREKARKILDPNGSGKVEFDGFKNCVLAGLKKLKEEGKI